jgi:acetyl esterase/lipase
MSSALTIQSTQAAVLAQKSYTEGVEGIVGQVLNIPVTCHPKHFPTGKYNYTSYEENKDAPVVDAKLMHWFWNHYLPGEENDAYASPLLAKDFKGLPPARKWLAPFLPLSCFFALNWT